MWKLWPHVVGLALELPGSRHSGWGGGGGIPVPSLPSRKLVWPAGGSTVGLGSERIRAWVLGSLTCHCRDSGQRAGQRW